ncbi:MAG: glycosyltransferase family 4 protein [Actinomycetota bacterium]
MTSVAINVDQLFFKVPGGIGTYVRQLLPALRAQSPDLDLSAFHSRFEGAAEAPELNGLRTTELDRSIRLLYPLWNLTGKPPLPDPLGSAEIVHAPSPVAVPPVRDGQKLVVTVHDLAFRLYPGAFPPSWRMLHMSGVKRTVRDANAVIAVSRNTASDLQKLTGIDPARIQIVPLGGSIPVGTGDPGAVLDRLSIPRPYVLFVGTLEPRKNVVRLIRAYRRIAPGVPNALVLAGPRGWRSQPVDRELAQPGHGRIIRTGRVSEDELDALYRGADAFAYPSLYEGFGLPVLDAMTRGVPVVTSNTSSLLDLAGEAAMRISPESVGAIAGAMEAVLTDQALSARLGAAGRERAREFSWERTARETLDVYEKALAG